MTDLIAFYGTLRIGGPDRGGPRPEGLLEFVQPCRIKGKLIDLGPYPGLLPDEGGTVIGDLFRIIHPDALRLYDDWEVYDPVNLEGSEYRREKLRLAEPDAEAWVYLWNCGPDDGPVIAGGDWFRR